MARINVNINPSVLLWARQEAGYNIDEVATKLSVNSDLYEVWEKEGKDIPFGKLQNLATYYKRQIAVFFLPEVPAKIKKPDFIIDIDAYVDVPHVVSDMYGFFDDLHKKIQTLFESFISDKMRGRLNDEWGEFKYWFTKLLWL